MYGKKRYGRNDFCPCGSRKKFKKCCLGKAQFSKTKHSDILKLRRINPMKTQPEPVKENPMKGVKGGLCNVTRCQSPDNVFHCNQWNGNTYYCTNCAVEFTEHDRKWTQGYRFNEFVPHPLLCSQEEVKWFLEHNNTFMVPVELREDGYWFNDYNQWYRVPDTVRSSLVVIDAHPADPGAHVLLRPERFRGKKFIDVCFDISNTGLLWEGNVYAIDKANAKMSLLRGEIFVASKGIIQDVDFVK